jgi:hypothetical protein
MAASTHPDGAKGKTAGLENGVGYEATTGHTQTTLGGTVAVTTGTGIVHGGHDTFADVPIALLPTRTVVILGTLGGDCVRGHRHPREGTEENKYGGETELKQNLRG